MSEYLIKLSSDQLGRIGDILSDAPWRKVNDILVSVQTQIDAADKENAELMKRVSELDETGG